MQGEILKADVSACFQPFPSRPSRPISAVVHPERNTESLDGPGLPAESRLKRLLSVFLPTIQAATSRLKAESKGEKAT
ncbi:MAG: hypothetical protein LBK45_00075 [Tannerellaceae bacterium]|nr:hypothetical protein [Tannerellaceae bacterium]